MFDAANGADVAAEAVAETPVRRVAANPKKSWRDYIEPNTVLVVLSLFLVTLFIYYCVAWAGVFFDIISVKPAAHVDHYYLRSARDAFLRVFTGRTLKGFTAADNDFLLVTLRWMFQWLCLVVTGYAISIATLYIGSAIEDRRMGLSEQLMPAGKKRSGAEVFSSTSLFALAVGILVSLGVFIAYEYTQLVQVDWAGGFSQLSFSLEPSAWGVNKTLSRSFFDGLSVAHDLRVCIYLLTLAAIFLTMLAVSTLIGIRVVLKANSVRLERSDPDALKKVADERLERIKKANRALNAHWEMLRADDAQADREVRAHEALESDKNGSYLREIDGLLAELKEKTGLKEKIDRFSEAVEKADYASVSGLKAEIVDFYNGHVASAFPGFFAALKDDRFEKALQFTDAFLSDTKSGLSENLGQLSVAIETASTQISAKIEGLKKAHKDRLAELKEGKKTSQQVLESFGRNLGFFKTEFNFLQGEYIKSLLTYDVDLNEIEEAVKKLVAGDLTHKANFSDTLNFRDSVLMLDRDVLLMRNNLYYTKGSEYAETRGRGLNVIALLFVFAFFAINNFIIAPELFDAYMGNPVFMTFTTSPWAMLALAVLFLLPFFILAQTGWLQKSVRKLTGSYDIATGKVERDKGSITRLFLSLGLALAVCVAGFLALQTFSAVKPFIHIAPSARAMEMATLNCALRPAVGESNGKGSWIFGEDQQFVGYIPDCDIVFNEPSQFNYVVVVGSASEEGGIADESGRAARRAQALSDRIGTDSAFRGAVLVVNLGQHKATGVTGEAASETGHGKATASQRPVLVFQGYQPDLKDDKALAAMLRAQFPQALRQAGVLWQDYDATACAIYRKEARGLTPLGSCQTLLAPAQ